MSLPASDDFNRGDLGNLGPNWAKNITDSIEQWSILSNEANANWTDVTARQSSVWDADPFQPDQYSEAVMTAHGATGFEEIGVVVRGRPGVEAGGSQAYDQYQFSLDNFTPVWRIVRILNGASSQLGTTGTISPSPPDTLRVEIRGVNLEGFVNGSSVLKVTNSAIESGKSGIMCVAKSDDANKFDNWEGGNLPSTDLDTKGWQAPFTTVRGVR